MLYEMAYKTINNRNIIIREESLNKAITKARENHTELYHSFYLYEDNLKEYIEKNKRISGYNGNVKLKHLIFDIDKKDDTDEFVLMRARLFVQHLLDEWNLYQEEIQTWFSGRGYHIEIPEYFNFGIGNITADVKNTITEHFPEVDPSLYDSKHLIRAPYSLNSKSNLYKIPLTLVEFFNLKVADIHKLAQSNDIRNIEIPDNSDLSERIETLGWHNKIIKNKVSRKTENKIESTAIVTCMQKLYDRGSMVGRRHTDMLRLTSAFRRSGVPKSGIKEMLYSFAYSMEKKETDKIVDTSFDKGYVYSCEDTVFAEFCDPKCIFYKGKNYSIKIEQAKDLENELIDYLLDENKVCIDLKRYMKLPEPYKIYLGELVVVIADTKMGKSTFMANIAVNYPEFSWLYITLENGRKLDLRRLIQISNGITEEQVIEYYSKGETNLTSYINHIQLTDTTMTLDTLRKVILERNCKIVVVDVLDQLILSENKKGDKIEEAAIELREMCKRLNVIIFVVHHITKASATAPLTAHSSKGSSSLEQKADKVIGIEGNQNADTRRIRSIVARDTNPFDVQCDFEKSTSRFIFER